MKEREGLSLRGSEMNGGGLDSVGKLGFSFLVGSPTTYKVITNFLLKVRIRGEGRVGDQVGKCAPGGCPPGCPPGQSPGVVPPLPETKCPDKLSINGWICCAVLGRTVVSDSFQPHGL